MNYRKLAKIADSNGHYEEFVDEDTGEIVKLWRKDETPEEKQVREAKEKQELAQRQERYDLARRKEKEIRKKYESSIQELLSCKSELQDVEIQLEQLEIDMEEDVGHLLSIGEEYDAEELAQEYGEAKDNLTDKKEELEARLKELKQIDAQMQKELDEVWNF